MLRDVCDPTMSPLLTLVIWQINQHGAKVVYVRSRWSGDNKVTDRFEKSITIVVHQEIVRVFAMFARDT